MRTADIYFLSFSILIGLSQLTSLGLYGYTYFQLENQMNGHLRLDTQVPTFKTPGLVGWVFFLVAFVPFYLLFYLIVKRSFLIDLSKPSSSSLQGWLAKGIRGNCFIILDGPFTQKRALNSARFYIVDLKHVAAEANWAEKFKYHELPAKKIITVDHLEYKLDDPEANHQKTYFLEKLLAGWRVMVISTADPISYRFANGTHTSQNGADRWSEVTSCFLKVYAEDDGSHTSFLDHLIKKRDDALGPNKSSSQVGW